MLFVDFINQVESEVSCMDELKASKMKEEALVEKRKKLKLGQSASVLPKLRTMKLMRKLNLQRPKMNRKMIVTVILFQSVPPFYNLLSSIRSRFV